MKKISRPQPASMAPVSSSPIRSSYSEASTAYSSSPLNNASSQRKEIFYEDASIPALYPHRLSLYLRKPDYEISIEEFEEFALARLEGKVTLIFILNSRFFTILVLKAVESAGIKNLKDDELFSWLRKFEQKHLPLHSNAVANRFNLLAERRRDEASHFILRLAFCGAVPQETLSSASSASGIEEGRRWFINQEVSLLRYRLQMIAQEGRAERDDFIALGLQLLSSPESPISPVSREELLQFAEDLRCLHPWLPADLKTAPLPVFYKVNWELVSDLVGRRALLLKRGFAFVPQADCWSIVLSRFREELERGLEAVAREIPFLQDDRIVPLLEALRRADYSLEASMASGSGAVAGALSAGDIEAASVNFPLCMQLLYRNLRLDRHLKFGGRQQFGLFLKSIGLTLEEALLFWRTAFAPKYSSDQFAKEYAYNIRHNYGQEGKRANYSSFSCAKICSSSIGDQAGCPYKSFAPDRLASALEVFTGPAGKLNSAQIKEVVTLAAEGHSQVACTRVFEFTRQNKGAAIETVTYPHKYYEQHLAKWILNWNELNWIELNWIEVINSILLNISIHFHFCKISIHFLPIIDPYQ